MFLFGLAYAGCDYTLAIILMTSAVAIHGAVSTGPLASFVDLSPNYASKFNEYENLILQLYFVLII